MKIISNQILNKNDTCFVWLHGWGQNMAAWNGFITNMDMFDHVLFDLPGFGQSPLPDSVWGSDDYARAIWQELDTMDIAAKNIILVGHSFGGKVCLQMASQRQKDIRALVLIGASGLKINKNLYKKARAIVLKYLGRLARFSDQYFNTKLRNRYENRFGSADYKAAQGRLRDILIKQVNEDLSNVARSIHTSTLILYGENDDQTPPIIGRKYSELIKDSRYYCLPALDHYTILSHGRHQVINLIDKLLKEKEK